MVGPLLIVFDLLALASWLEQIDSIYRRIFGQLMLSTILDNLDVILGTGIPRLSALNHQGELPEGCTCASASMLGAALTARSRPMVENATARKSASVARCCLARSR
jgi:hypothetical protein